MPTVLTRLPRGLHAAASDLAGRLGLSIGEALELMVLRSNADEATALGRRMRFTKPGRPVPTTSLRGREEPSDD